MKLNKIIILALVFSMLLINVTSVFASEMETDNLKIIDASIENTSENKNRK